MSEDVYMCDLCLILHYRKKNLYIQTSAVDWSIYDKTAEEKPITLLMHSTIQSSKFNPARLLQY